MNEQAKSLGLWALSVSILCLALAIAYFAWEAHLWRTELPQILIQTEKTADKINLSINNVSEIGKLVPPILDEVGKTRKVVEKTAEQVKLTREQLPTILKDIEPITRQIENTTQQLPTIIPPVLDEVRKTRELVPGILKEVHSANITVDKATVEVAKTREAMPGILDRADKIVRSAEKAGEEAGQGAVSGILGGIITMPFKVVGSLGKAAFGLLKAEDQAMLTQQDIALMDAKIQALTDSGTVGQTGQWNNKASSNSGSVTLEKRYESEGKVCAAFKIEINLKGKKTKTSMIKGCRQPDGTWQATEGALPGE